MKEVINDLSNRLPQDRQPTDGTEEEDTLGLSTRGVFREPERASSYSDGGDEEEKLDYDGRGTTNPSRVREMKGIYPTHNP